MGNLRSSVLGGFFFRVNPMGAKAGRRGRRRRLIPIECLENRTLLSAVTWVGVANGGDWDGPGNWSGGQVPSGADDVTIGANISINHAAGVGDAVHSIISNSGDTLNLTGGSIAIGGVPSGQTASTLFNLNLAGGGTLLIGAPTTVTGGASNWNGGTIDGQGGHTITNTGAMTIAGGDKNLTDGAVLDNKAAVTETSGRLLTNNGTITNESGGTWDLQGGTQILPTGGAQGFTNNGGTLETSTGNATLNVAYNSIGATAKAFVNSSLTLGAGGTSTGGQFVADGGGVVDLAGSSNATYTGTYTGSGTGTVQLSNGQINIGAAGATFNFPAGLFQWVGGTISGSGANTLINAATGFITIAGGADKGLANGATLDNQGSIIETAGRLLTNNSTITNEKGASYDFQGGSQILPTGGAQGFNNAGTFKTSTGTAVLGASYNSVPGAITQADTNASLTLAAGGSSTGGNYVAAAGATIDLAGGSTVSFTGAYTGSGAGTVQLSNGRIVVSGMGATFSFPAGLFQWIGGNIEGGGGNVLTNTGFMTLAGGDKGLANAITLDNQATIIHTQGRLLTNNSIVTNESGATYDFQNASPNDITLVSTGGAAGFNNGGLLSKSKGAANVTFSGIPFNNGAKGAISITTSSGTPVVSLAGAGTDAGGTFAVSAGATLDLTGGSGPLWTGTYTGSGPGAVVLGSGTINVGKGGATLNFPSGLFQWNSGTIDGQGGHTLTNVGMLTLGGNDKNLANAAILDNKGSIAQNAGRLLTNNSTITNENGAVFDLQGGTQIVTTGGANGFNNLAGGKLEKSTGAANNAVLNIAYNSAPDAVVESDAGTLVLANGGTSTGGTFVVPAAGNVIDPTGGSTVAYTGTYTGTGSGAVRLANGTIGIAQGGATFNFPAGLFQWTGGTIDGQGGNILTNAGSGFITLSGGGDRGLANGTTLDNMGTIVETGGRLLTNNSTITNEGGAVYDLQGGSQILTTGGMNGFNNVAGGKLKKSTGSGNAILFVAYNSVTNATAESDAGTLVFASGGSSTGGTFTAPVAGDIIDLTGGQAPSFSGTYIGSGSGTVQLASGQITLGAGGATFNFPAGLFQWTGGTIDGQGGRTLINTGMMTLAGGDKGLANAATLDNRAKIVQTAGRLLPNNSTITNENGAVFDLQGGTQIVTTGGANGFNNLAGGILKKSTGAANTALVDVAYNSVSGAIAESDAGTLTLGLGGTSTGGTFNAPAVGNVIDLTGGNADAFTGTYVGSGNGTVLLASGTIAIGKGGATFNFPAGLFHWTGGNIDGSGGNTLTNAPTGFMTLDSGDRGLSGGAILDNQGSIVEPSGRLLTNNATITNEAGAVYDLQQDAQIIPTGGAQGFTNAGKLEKTIGGATAVLAVSLDNPGTTEVDAGTLQITSAFPQFSNGVLGAGTWSAFNGSTLSTTGIGSITSIANGATVTLSGGGASWPSLANSLASNGGTLSLLGGATLSTPSDLGNSSSLTLGTGATSNSGSTLSVTGKYAQSSTGSVAVQIGGTPASAEFGSINAGAVQLGGALVLSPANSFAPAIGSQYTIVHNTGTSPVTGTFSGLAEGQAFSSNGLSFTITYAGGANGRDVVLNATQSSMMGPHLVSVTIGDGTAQRSEVRGLTFKFDHAVTLAAGAVTLAVFPGNDTTGTPTDASAALGTPVSSDGGITWTVPVLVSTTNSDSTGSLKDSIYGATVHAAKVTDASNNSLQGGDQATTFHRLFGDINGDKKINNSDYFQFNKAFGSTRGGALYNANFDFNGDGKINNSDYFQFNKNFGKVFTY